MLAIKQKSLKKAESELSALRKQLENTHDLLEQGVYTVEVFLDRSRSIGGRIAEAERDRAVIAQEIGSEMANEENRLLIAPKIERLLKTYDLLPSAAVKNELLKEILEKAVYKKEKSGAYRDASPDGFELVIFPRLPKAEV
jgi:hypothetical protein